MNRRMTMAAALGLSALLALGACGRKGDLEPPPSVSPDMASKAGCQTGSGTTQKPIDAEEAGDMAAPNQMPDTSVPPC
ncbi:LPS translocon maturation chaperone LptM [Parvibaculum sp.]|uniref:LPS translocon maturation chaperone LptM n=1 Tax=Parvibaculum sp. TaxID=2024848 RepID=UPI002C1BC567|nr:lipoprotein [Parvibaculum sp.]HUD52922.1 lipoprotein [Parvibaculum sp.]